MNLRIFQISGIEQHRASLNGADVYYSISAGAVSPTGAYIASGNKTKIDMLKVLPSVYP